MYMEVLARDLPESHPAQHARHKVQRSRRTTTTTRFLASGSPPKLLRDILFDDAPLVEFLLALGLGFFALVFGEVGDVFGMGEVFFTGICEGGGGMNVSLGLWGAMHVCMYACVYVRGGERGRDRATYSHRGTFRNGGSHIRTRRRRGGLVRAR